MNIQQTKFTLKNLPPRKSVLIEGIHGIGKSQVVAQVAAELSKETGKTYHLIDIRLAEREVGDLIGMPRDVDNYTINLFAYRDGKPCSIPVSLKNVSVNDLPAWYPRDPGSFGILFLDELHYASKDVLNAAFELSLDYRLNGVPLPQGWRVVAAGNHNQDIYGGTSINPALYDRFLKIELKPTVQEWLDWAAGRVIPVEFDESNQVVSYGPVHRAIQTYITKFPADLDPPDRVEPGVIYPSRRSWASLAEVIEYQTRRGSDPLKNLDYLTLLAIGYVGKTVAINFVEYIRKSYKVHSAADILDKLTPEMVKEFAEMQPAEIAFYTSEVVNYIKDTLKGKLSKKQSDNLAKFFVALSKEAAAGFWILFIKEVRETATKWYNEHSEVSDYIMSFLQKSRALA